MKLKKININRINNKMNVNLFGLRVLSTLLILVLISSLLTGCGKKDIEDETVEIRDGVSYTSVGRVSSATSSSGQENNTAKGPILKKAAESTSLPPSPSG